MGYIRPTTIIVTGSYHRKRIDSEIDGLPFSREEHYAEWAHRHINLILSSFGRAYESAYNTVLSPIVSGVANDVKSFMIAWDGSKEGWEVSDTMDEARAKIVKFLQSAAYGDRSSPLDWVEIQYGGDDCEVKVLNHGDNYDDNA